LGLMIALWFYVRKYKVNLMRVLDNIAIATPITACFIRLGNLMNSEIVGKPTDSALGFIFVQNHETFARHPGQLYEALFYLFLFPVGLWLYKRYKTKVGTGYFFGWVLTCIFAFRFFVEFLKEVQEPWELSMVETIGLNQGQMLSIPFVVLGLYCWLGGKYCKKLGEQPTQKKP
jgi:prolipoprotein diacylglyceryl transferase